MSKYGYDVPIQHDEWETNDTYREVGDVVCDLLDGKGFTPSGEGDITRLKINQGKDTYGRAYAEVLQNASISCYITSMTGTDDKTLLMYALKSAKGRAEAYIEEINMILEELNKQEKSC